MLDRISGFFAVDPLALVLSMLVIAAIPLGVLRLVFSIGNWKTRMGILPGIKTARRRVHKC